MNRSDFLKLSALSAFAIPSLNFRSIFESRLKEIRGGVGTFSLRGGTIGWYKSDDVLVMVDTQFADTVTEFISEIVADGQQLEFVINTHHHGDHTGGNKVAREKAQKIVAHKNVPINQVAAAKARNTESDQAYADVTYEKSLTLELDKERIQLSYFGNAHTSGDSLVHFQNTNVAHVGDLVFHHMPAYIDRGAGANVENWIIALEKIYNHLNNDTKVIFGHANQGFEIVGNRNDIRHKQAFLSACQDYIRNGLKDGKSVEELVDVPFIPGFEDHESKTWAAGMKNMLTALHGEIVGN